MDKQQDSRAVVSVTQIPSDELSLQRLLKLDQRPVFGDLDLNGHVRVRCLGPNADIRLILPQHVGFPFNGVAPALVPLEPVRYPVLDVDFVWQARDRRALRIVRVQEIVLEVAEPAKRQPLQVDRIARRDHKIGFEGADIRRRPSLTLRVRPRSITRKLHHAPTTDWETWGFHQAMDGIKSCEAGCVDERPKKCPTGAFRAVPLVRGVDLAVGVIFVVLELAAIDGGYRSATVIS